MQTSRLIEAFRVPLGLCATEAIIEPRLGISSPNYHVRECFESIDSIRRRYKEIRRSQIMQVETSRKDTMG